MGLYGYVGMNPSVQLVTELNTTHMSYIDLNTLALALPKRQLALQKSTAEQRLMWEMLRVLDKAQHKERDQDVARALREMRGKALAKFSKQLDDGQAIYEGTARQVANQVAVRATQEAIRAGGVTERCDANNTDTHTDDEQPQAEEPGDDYGGEVPRDVCLGEAIDGHCTDKLCWRKHDAESIEQYKAALGAKRWEKQKQWWNRWKTRKTRGSRRPSTLTADDMDGAEVDTNKTKVDTEKAEISTGSRRKGARSVYMLYGDSARGQACAQACWKFFYDYPKNTIVCALHLMAIPLHL